METNYSNLLNESELVVYDSTTSKVLWILSMVVLSITFVLGVLGNGLVIWVAGFRMAHTVTSIFYLNLALADFSFTATLPFRIISIAMKEKWPFGWFLCKFFHLVVGINLFGSIFLITLIALDRCICVLHPVWAQNHRTVRLAKKMIFGPWIFALALTLPIFFLVNTISDLRGDVYCSLLCEITDETAVEDQLNRFITMLTANNIITFIIGFCMPMSIIVICYGLIAAKIHRRAVGTSRHPLRVLTAVVASFFICWFPYQLVILLNTLWFKEILFSGGHKILGMLSNPIMALAFFNSCLNPMLYVFMGQNFRKRLIHSLPSSLERALSEDVTQISNIGSNSVASPADIEIKAI